MEPILAGVLFMLIAPLAFVRMFREGPMPRIADGAWKTMTDPLSSLVLEGSGAGPIRPIYDPVTNSPLASSDASFDLRELKSEAALLQSRVAQLMDRLSDISDAERETSKTPRPRAA